jgi:hypothetical protein
MKAAQKRVVERQLVAPLASSTWQDIDVLEASQLFKQNEAALMTKADLREATVVVLGDVEEVLAVAASQLFNMAVVTI